MTMIPSKVLSEHNKKIRAAQAQPKREMRWFLMTTDPKGLRTTALADRAVAVGKALQKMAGKAGWSEAEVARRLWPALAPLTRAEREGVLSDLGVRP